MYEGERDELLPGLRDAAAAARRIAHGTVSLENGLAQLDAGLDRARAGADRLASGQATMASRLGDLADGANRVADGSARVAGGTAEMTGSVGDLRTGLTRAASYLRTTGKAASDPAIGGFYLPPRAFDNPRFALATGLFMSRDGRMARMVVLGESDAFGAEASARTVEIREAVADGLRGTRLENTEVQTSGLPSVNADLDEMAGSVTTLAQIGFTIGVGLLLDTFVVRTLVVPAFAALMGPRLWWPAR